ncbi:MAG TPA: ribosome-associated translation inhibitor RaiA [Chitinophagales bacterium]|nr:ribosome-associated translation inhibitor RaiA [Chitinophagales bacterium]
MQIQIQSIHWEADEALRKAVTEKLSRLEKFYDRIEKCNVILKKEKNARQKSYVAEVRLAVPKQDLFASERAESFEGALELIMADLKKQLIRHKDKLKEPRRLREKLTQ